MARLVGLMTIAAFSIGLSAVSAGPLQSQEGKNAERPVVTGRWSGSIEGTPHGTMSMSLTLKQDGQKVTGILTTDHTGDLAVEGEFVDGTLKLATASSEGESQLHLTMSGKFKDNDTMTGYMSAQVGDMTWTAARVKDKS
jgi:hypothetical protein